MSGDLSFESESGELSFLLQAPPVSLQCTRARKDALTELIREHSIQRDYLLTGEPYPGPSGEFYRVFCQRVQAEDHGRKSFPKRGNEGQESIFDGKRA